MALTQQQIQEVWENGISIPNFDPQVYRKDFLGAWICRLDFNRDKTSLSFGWTVDPIVSQSSEGDHNLQTLRPLQWENIESVVESQPNPKVIAYGIKNIYNQ